MGDLINEKHGRRGHGSKTTRVSPNLSFKLTNWVICLNKANVMKFHGLLNLQLIASWSGPHPHSKSHRFTSMISMIFWQFFFVSLLSHVENENSCLAFFFLPQLFAFHCLKCKSSQSLVHGQVTSFFIVY